MGYQSLVSVVPLALGSRSPTSAYCLLGCCVFEHSPEDWLEEMAFPDSLSAFVPLLALLSQLAIAGSLYVTPVIIL